MDHTTQKGRSLGPVLETQRSEPTPQHKDDKSRSFSLPSLFTSLRRPGSPRRVSSSNSPLSAVSQSSNSDSPAIDFSVEYDYYLRPIINPTPRPDFQRRNTEDRHWRRSSAKNFFKKALHPRRHSCPALQDDYESAPLSTDKYTLNLPLGISQDKSEFDYLRRTNREAAEAARAKKAYQQIGTVPHPSFPNFKFPAKKLEPN